MVAGLTEAGYDRRLLEGRSQLRTHELADLVDLTPDLQQPLGRAVQDRVVAVEHLLEKAAAAQVGTDAGVLDPDPLEPPVRRRDAYRQLDLVADDAFLAAFP